MKSTVVGSFPASESSPSNFKEKLLNSFGSFDPFKQAIKDSVIAQLDAGVDIISDGQVRGDMVSIFTKYIPGMKIEDGNTFIIGKIRNPTQEISIKDLQPQNAESPIYSTLSGIEKASIYAHHPNAASLIHSMLSGKIIPFRNSFS